ncbi:hypothetical protein [Sphingomicrobium marinum]|uniref:hypothetical protein n=1 Tax=Sphingomicrobium marinum TaxID=1227950 RepID=UPI002240DD19|nr:hypothetical protein [Sphingomicrobium marinum]
MDSETGDVLAQVAGISQLIQLALERNLARGEEIGQQVRELFPSKEPLFWNESNVPVDNIRAPLREAERLLRDINITDGPNPGVSETPHLRELRQRYGELVQATFIELGSQRLNASWSYIDLVEVAPLIDPIETPVLYLVVTLPLGKSHKKHEVTAEEHNQSGYHLHYAKLNGIRSDVLFAFGRNPPDPENPVTWERHGSGKARYFPDPESWNFKKRENVNKVCLAAKAKLPSDARLFTPSRNSKFLLPI